MSNKQPISEGIIAQAVAGLKNVVNAWFGPLDPLPVMVPEQQQPGVHGRQFDYPVGFNRQTRPRSGEAISFEQLRAIADNCDVLRLAIETRKDQMEKLKWTITPIDSGAEPDKRCDDLTEFFKFPDKEHDWDTWLRMILEDLFVLDAPTLYCSFTYGNKPYAFEPLDGSKIKRVLTEQGRTPQAPDPAYQHILKGIVATDYTVDELIYKPRNQRTHKIYGYSPVEQIIMTVNIALRRALHQLQYYTEGNIPEALIGVPENWNVDQIKQFQAYWDSILEGDTAQRRHAKFVPGKMTFQPTKNEVLKDEYDEWLARIVCYAFSLPPTAFVKQMNRATAGTAQEVAIEEGLAPIMKWVVNLMNFIIQMKFGFKDLQFGWADEKVQDPLQRAQVNEIYINTGVILPEEVRDDLGLDDFTPEQLAQIAAAKAPAPPSVSGALETQNESAGPPIGEKPTAGIKEAVEKAKKAMPGVIDGDRASIAKLRNKLAGVVAKFLSSQAPIIAAKLHAKLAKGEKTKSVVDDEDINFDDLFPDVSVLLGAISKDGAAAGLAEVGSDADADGPATTWAMNRAAEMIGKKLDEDGNLIDNPDAKWVITDSTRDMINNMVADAIDNGASTNELADLLSESFAFSDERAQMIARTETRMADSAGQIEGYKSSGVVQGTVWSTAGDDGVDEICVANADAGVIPLGELYPSGDEAPPAHPNCRCAIVAELIEDEDSGDN